MTKHKLATELKRKLKKNSPQLRLDDATDDMIVGCYNNCLRCRKTIVDEDKFNNIIENAITATCFTNQMRNAHTCIPTSLLPKELRR